MEDMQVKESTYTNEFEASVAQKSSQGYTIDKFNETGSGVTYSEMPEMMQSDIMISSNKQNSSIAMESGFISASNTGKNTAMIENNKKLSSALAQMQ